MRRILPHRNEAGRYRLRKGRTRNEGRYRLRTELRPGPPTARLFNAHIKKAAIKRMGMTVPKMRPMVNGVVEGMGGMSEPGWKTGEEEAVGEAVVANRGVGPMGTAEGVVVSPGDGEGEDEVGEDG
jgi:hypothetical protein